MVSVSTLDAMMALALYVAKKNSFFPELQKGEICIKLLEGNTKSNECHKWNFCLDAPFGLRDFMKLYFHFLQKKS